MVETEGEKLQVAERHRAEGPGEDMAHHEVVHDAREQEAHIDHDWYGQRDRGMNLGVVWD